MTFIGRVERRQVGRGSKSEHRAVVLITEGAEYVLRRRGGNAFRDPALDALVGRTMEFQGEPRATTLHVTAWREVRKTEGG